MRQTGCRGRRGAAALYLTAAAAASLHTSRLDGPFWVPPSPHRPAYCQSCVRTTELYNIVVLLRSVLKPDSQFLLLLYILTLFTFTRICLNFSNLSDWNIVQEKATISESSRRLLIMLAWLKMYHCKKWLYYNFSCQIFRWREEAHFQHTLDYKITILISSVII